MDVLFGVYDNSVPAINVRNTGRRFAINRKHGGGDVDKDDEDDDGLLNAIPRNYGGTSTR